MTVLIATICTAGLLLMLLSGYLISLDGEGSGIETEADRDARLAETDYLAPAREELTELVDLTAVAALPWPWTLPPEPGLSTRYRMYEQLGVNRVRTVEEILASIGDTTIEFNRLMTAEFLAQKCDSCEIGRDGERQHQSCVGCSCHCGDGQGAEIIHIGQPGRNEWMAADAA